MATNVNSASRTLAILRRASQNPQNFQHLPASANWLRVFEIPESYQGIQRDAELCRLLGLLYEEVTIAHKKMPATGLNADKYDSVFHALYSSITIVDLATAWTQFQQYLSDRNLELLSVYSEVLSNEEVQLTPDELTKVRADIEALRESVLNGSLSEGVKIFLLDQIRIMLDAINAYPVIGRRAFEVAARYAVATMAYASDVATEASTTDQFATLKATWAFLMGATAAVDTGQKFIEAAKSVAEALGTYMG